MRPDIKIGAVFGRLTVRSFESKGIASCDCTCGTQHSVRVGRLLKGNTRSCGCLRREVLKSHRPAVTHGDSRARLNAIYRTIKFRCAAGKGRDRTYVENGIQLCAQWQDYTVFRDWALSQGFQPGDSILRKDTMKDFSPDNCEVRKGRTRIPPRMSRNTTERPSVIAIESGIPIPKEKMAGPAYPFAKMKVGDSFLVPHSRASAMKAAKQYYQSRHSAKFTVRKVAEGTRVWRTQ